MISIISLLLLSKVILIHASYSLSYYSNEATKILNAGLHSFQDTPTAQHIADIYTRISGLSPILREGIIFQNRFDNFLDLKSVLVMSESCKIIFKYLFYSLRSEEKKSMALSLYILYIYVILNLSPHVFSKHLCYY